MIYAGEYPQPLVRTTNLKCPVVGGYVTARLQLQGTGTTAVSGYADNTVMVVAENTGSNVQFRLQQTNDYTSGPWEWLGNAQSLVPQGHLTYTVNPRSKYLEVKGMAGTSAGVNFQLSSRLRWDILGFDKTDPVYPPFLYNARTPTTSAV
jgi:hypothetical protein